MTDNDKERQEDEVEVLESIYPKELTIISKFPASGCLKISPSIPKEEFSVKVITKLDENTEERVFKIKHLPPIEIYFQCPNDYPSKSEPRFMLQCLWLSDEQLAQICKKLDYMWDNDQSEILFTWASFLKEDCCVFLKIEELSITVDMNFDRFDSPEKPESVGSTLHSSQNRVPDILKEYAAKTLNVKPLDVKSNDPIAKRRNMNSKLKYFKRSKLRRKDDDDSYKYETPKDLKNKEKSTTERNVGSDKPAASKSKEDDTNKNLAKINQIFKIINMFGLRRKGLRDTDDTRVLSKSVEECRLVVKVIESYNDRVLETEFRTESHSCEVCFDVKSGSECVRVKPCGHAFCKNCVRDYLTLNVTNGNVGAIRCLQYDCESPLSDVQVRLNVDEEVYAKYRKFSVRLAVDNDPNLLYCPRIICQSVARISGLSPDMCHCENCGFYFCIFCKKAYHGVQMCNLKKEEHLKVIQEYQDCSPERKKELEKRFSKQQLLKWVEDDLSEKWLERCSKPCPNCRAVIQKVDGCNKMMCLNCNTPFCWLCNLTLNRTQPYLHFSDPNSPCYQKLFPEEVLQEEDEFVDEEEEEQEFFDLIDEMLVNFNDAALEDWPYYFIA